MFVVSFLFLFFLKSLHQTFPLRLVDQRLPGINLNLDFINCPLKRTYCVMYIDARWSEYVFALKSLPYKELFYWEADAGQFSKTPNKCLKKESIFVNADCDIPVLSPIKAFYLIPYHSSGCTCSDIWCIWVQIGCNGPVHLAVLLLSLLFFSQCRLRNAGFTTSGEVLNSDPILIAVNESRLKRQMVRGSISHSVKCSNPQLLAGPGATISSSQKHFPIAAMGPCFIIKA